MSTESQSTAAQLPAPPPALLPVEEPPVTTQPTMNLEGVAASTGNGGGNTKSLLCDNCSASGHLRRNCPKIKCNLCGRRGHFRRDCPQDPAKRLRSVDEAANELDHRWAVCRSCGSSRHIQAQCPVRFQALECYQCHQRGHMMTTCPQTRCFNCGTFGHSSQVCHSKPHCFHCSHSGHRSSECPMRSKGRVCYQCNEPGHEAANCPQGQLCRMCHQPGHLVAHCPEVMCDVCHEKGHTAGVCEKNHCDNCGGMHGTVHCPQPYVPQMAHDRLSDEHSPDEDTPGSNNGDDSDSSNDCETPSTVAMNGGDKANKSTVAATQVIPPYVTQAIVKREGRVAVVIDGAYFERCVTLRRNRGDADYYRHIADALRHTIDFLGDIFQREPFAYWFDTDTTAFTEFIETSMPLAHRERAFRETTARKLYLTDEMNSGRSLPNVVAKLVGGMKRQRGYTEDGPGHVWVQTGVDVATATCVIRLFQDHRQFQQVVLLCGDADVYPAVQYCNGLRHTTHQHAECPPVRVCGTSDSMSKLYGQHQDLADFLPRILLDRPSHTEAERTIEFATSEVFRSA
ncbi:hypothetical protein ABB37_03706 [Leptomonas pyrrhocoris]|uniref:CCHC-type domain-containing protein n=1 Tax=Leptomonas pyrrhocoris TaxID=157538 RepID=A0A0N0VFJ0_LEPPY|nr:hypothetical protein ABB37_03706 [Leptomonas pyrrhocoris]XP_015659741.1 hypothetical protein ABB37_03706 [Leptomonas pyrrhocoris]KPA81301.1 hypothetical protein ABB37_03706 [Leptomonas pyrrhocoris]KPA81302.1 hypothetical protein ABB37_03706 [Leptomonas pyrrhocoris]|eukprot:XP_015659740.1 hypothetical protein ABB37_03706 [Leptomonas pyrrhocoris]